MAVTALLGAACAVAGAVGALALAIQLAILAVVTAVAGFVMHRRLTALAGHRRLDGVQRARLLDQLRRTPTIAVTVSAPRGDAEAIGFAVQLLQVLRDASWPAKGVRTVGNPEDVATSGIVVAVAAEADQPPREEARLLLVALARAGLAPVTRASARVPDRDQVELFVGRRE